MKLPAHQRLRTVSLVCVKVRCTGEIKHLRSAHKFDLYLQAPDNPNKSKHVESPLISLSGPGFESLLLHLLILKAKEPVNLIYRLFCF